MKAAKQINLSWEKSEDNIADVEEQYKQSTTT